MATTHHDASGPAVVEERLNGGAVQLHLPGRQGFPVAIVEMKLQPEHAVDAADPEAQWCLRVSRPRWCRGGDNSH